MDTFSEIVKYALFGVLLVIAAIVLLLRVVERHRSRFLAKLPVGQWLTYYEVLSLGGNDKSLTRHLLESFVKNKWVEIRPSHTAYSFAGPEEMKLIANTTKFEVEKAEYFDYLVIRRPHGPRRPPKNDGGPTITSGGPYMPA